MANVIGPGGTSVPSSNTEYLDALLSTTLKNYRDTLYDNIFKESAFLSLLRTKGAVKKQNGGERVAMPLMYGKNDTVKSYSGYETIDTTPVDGITTAYETWREVAGSITISRKEERQNSGEGRIINLLEAKTQQAEMSMREKLNEMLLQGTVSGTTFVPGNGGKDLNPLGYFLSKDNTANPTTGGNVGNISRVTESWWRQITAKASGSADTGNSFGLTVTTYAGLKVALLRTYNYCSRGGGGSPDMVIMDQVSFESYNNALDAQTRYYDTKMADMGFDTIKLRGATVIWDELTPDISQGKVSGESSFLGSAFFLNSKFYNLIIDSETDMVVTPFIEPENQTAKTAKILFMGNAAVSNLRKLGVLYGISQSIVS